MVRIPLLRAPVLRSLLPFKRQLLPAPATSGARYLHRSPPRLGSNSNNGGGTHSTASGDDMTLSQRLKHLIKNYGWYAIGVYTIFSVVDFSIAFAGINLLGAEQVSRVVATVKESINAFVHSRPPEPGREDMDGANGTYGSKAGQEGLYAMLVLAYTVHKTLFLPLRVGLTAAFTPRIVGWLTQRGWVGRDGAKRAAAEIREKN